MAEGACGYYLGMLAGATAHLRAHACTLPGGLVQKEAGRGRKGNGQRRRRRALPHAVQYLSIEREGGVLRAQMGVELA